MHTSYYRLIMTAFIIMGLTTSVFGQNSADEARKYLVRGMTAIETSKGTDGLAQAAKEFKKATEIAPTMAAAWYNLGSVQSKMGQLEDAIVSYRRYLSLAPKADDAQQVRDEIVRLEFRMEQTVQKIGCYDLKEVFENINAGKVAKEQFKNFYEKKAAIIKDVERELKSRKDDLEKNGPSMAAAAKEAAEADYQKRIKEYQSLVNNTNDELKKRDREMAEQLTPQILMIVNRIKEKNNYTKVLEKNIDEITCSKDRDITNRIIEECNQYPITYSTK